MEVPPKSVHGWVNAKASWENKSPYEKWLTIFNFVKFVGSSCLQLHSIFENKPIGPIGYIPSFICGLSYTLLLYTTYYYTVAGNLMGCLPSYYMFGVCVSVSWLMREILPICELLILMWILKCMHLVDKGILCLLECSSQDKRSAMARPNKCAGTVHLSRLWTGNRLWSHLLRMSGLFNKTIHNNDIGGIPIWLMCLDWTNVYIFQRWYNYNIVQYASTIFLTNIQMPNSLSILYGKELSVPLVFYQFVF